MSSPDSSLRETTASRVDCDPVPSATVGGEWHPSSGSPRTETVNLKLRRILFAVASTAFSSSLFTGCHKPAPPSTNQAPQPQFRQADRGEALLKAATDQLNDLPAAVDTELRPPVVVL